MTEEVAGIAGVIYASCASDCSGAQHSTIATGLSGAPQRLKNSAVFRLPALERAALFLGLLQLVLGLLQLVLVRRCSAKESSKKTIFRSSNLARSTPLRALAAEGLSIPMVKGTAEAIQNPFYKALAAEVDQHVTCPKLERNQNYRQNGEFYLFEGLGKNNLLRD